MGTYRYPLAFDGAREYLVDLPDVPDGPESFTARLAGVLAGGIVAGLFRQGQRMPGIPAVAWRFRTSRDTAREALILLERDGWVRRVPGGGAYVRVRAGRGGPQ